MLWMENYLFYCSVRLGVMVISVVAFISTFVPSLLLFIFGLDVLDPILKTFNDDDHFRKHFIVKTFTNMVDNDSDKLLALFQLYLFSHMATSLVAFYGALKIKKYYLIPLAIFEFSRLIYCLASHILLMTVCKNKFNLGILITATLGGGFVILYLGYNWTTIVALYQIITLIKSERYKSIYGDDPFHPLIPKTYNPFATEKIRVLVTPNNQDVDDLKKRSRLIHNSNAVQPTISVLPVNYSQNAAQRNESKKKWMASRWASPSQKPLIVPPVHSNPPVRNEAYGNSYSVDYANWQWSELAPAVSARNKKNIYGYNWKY